jgi:hypothetical protein
MITDVTTLFKDLMRKQRNKRSIPYMLYAQFNFFCSRKVLMEIDSPIIAEGKNENLISNILGL